MPATSASVNGHRRASSSSTVRAGASVLNATAATETLNSVMPAKATLWVHDDNFSQEEILINPSILNGSRIGEGSLVEVARQVESTNVLDFEEDASDSGHKHKLNTEEDLDQSAETKTCLCIVKFATPDMLLKHQGLEVSITKTIAEAFNLQSRAQIVLKPANFKYWTASHIEFTFRDAYLARSDMWRLVSQELANKIVYKGQKISFLGTMKLTVKDVHLKGHRVSTGFFAATTIPVFRSEAARYVLFIQMSREMWDFDAEGNGEIMFNRVINGFLPDLFRRWVQLEVRHLVSIVMFGRLEYDRYDFGDYDPAIAADRFSLSSAATSTPSTFHQDFFRVVVTDMASAQWTTILNELKKDFRVFLRDISLHAPVSVPFGKDSKNTAPKITGRPSTALKGNILEAINLASSQFANDYIDRDLIRTGVSTVVITAGTGVFDVDRDLLNLTSENLTNNGIGIDIVCLSKMPLHSVPLFRYRLPQSTALSRVDSSMSSDSHGLGTSIPGPSISGMNQSSALSSFTGTSLNYFSRFPSAFPSRVPQLYGYGIPHWIDLSYWSLSADGIAHRSHRAGAINRGHHVTGSSRRSFVPRVRMYELQMMGLMELGMADISIPYITETSVKPKHPRHQRSVEFPPAVSTRSLSQSPTYFRKASALGPRQKDSMVALTQVVGINAPSPATMEEYDDSIFLHVSKPKKILSKQKKSRSQKSKKMNKQSQTKSLMGQDLADGSEKDFLRPLQSSPKSLKTVSNDSATTSLTKTKVKQKTPRISRSISYALRGLPAPLRSSVTSDINLENVKALPAIATTSLTQANATSPSIMRAESIRGSEIQEMDARSVLSSDSASENLTKPISIRSTRLRPVSQQVSHKLEKPIRIKMSEGNDGEKYRTTWPSSPSQSSEDEASGIGSGHDNISDSVPQSGLPFIRNVNASNPLKRQPKAESTFGRWQHLYPHKPRASTVKWRSLCTPASVPLTTEDFPTSRELVKGYETTEHHVRVRQTAETSDVAPVLNSLLFEMVVLRLSHGYQIVIGEIVRKVIGNTLCETSVFMDPAHLSQHGDTIMMSMGNTIQKLAFGDEDVIHVTRYVKKEIESEHPFSLVYSYTPNIRTILATEYWSRSMELRGFSEEYPWEMADNYLAEGEPDASSKVNKLRFWRARFVLLPVEPPSNTWRPQQNSDENEEEIHLLGIRALTQMWQKARYLAPSDRKTGPGRLAGNRRRDQNPLEVKFETLNPSEIVATELDRLLALEESGEVSSTQLLPDSEKLDRNTSMTKLAQSLQGEKGIEIRNRRWHLRLHYNCFHGEELTNWLLLNVKDVEARENAVEFGNQLMKEGLFEHVNGRHNFKDGNYFYSLKQDFRAHKVDVKGSWFASARRSDKSVPPTPISEHTTRDGLQIATRSRSGSSLAYSLNASTPLESSRGFIDRRKKTVTLTKMIKIDVDPRKRSNRAEIVNLHYDRFHNPENCYHIELSWLNATSKLVDDAIVAWTNQAERFGLKLVEVPMAEASKIPNSEPFRRAYQIKLVTEPPKRNPVSHVLTSSSFTPQPSSNSEKHFYQKAILRRFNFVLDLEGSAEFPENVDVQYSSAGLEYKYTQYVHRSGVCLAQITDDGDFLLLANRLYNARFVNSKENSSARFDHKKEPMTGPGLSHRPPVPPSISSTVQLQASGIIGLNVQSPGISATSSPSPLPRVTADVLGSRSAISNSSIAQYTTPEQIKDEVEQFCSDSTKLENFYKEHNGGASTVPPPSGAPRRSTGTSSSALKPIQDTNEGIPEFVLPESVTSPSASSSGFGLGFGGLMSRRPRASVAYDSVAEMFGRAGISGDRNGSSRDRNAGDPGGGGGGVQSNSASKGNSGEVSGRTSGDVSGHLELKVRVDTPGGHRIEEGIEEGMNDSIGSPKVRNRSSS